MILIPRAMTTGLLLLILVQLPLCHHYDHKDVLGGLNFDDDVLTAQLAKLQSCGYLQVDPAFLAIDGRMALKLGFLDTYFPDPCPENADGESSEDDDGTNTGVCLNNDDAFGGFQLILLTITESCNWYTRKDLGACLQALNLSPCEATADRQLANLVFVEQQSCRPVEPHMFDSHHPFQGEPGWRKCRRGLRDLRHLIFNAAYWNAVKGNTRL